MFVISSTDGKYIGMEVPKGTKVGDTVLLDDFEFSVQNVFALENGHVLLASPNYQLELEE